MSSSRVWLVTAATSGLGAALVETIAAHGDRVIASGRNAEERLAQLKSDRIAVLDLDVAAGKSQVAAQVDKAWAIYGKIDVLFNNAGVSSPNSIEEASDSFVQEIFNINVFGNLHVTQAILPHFRAQKSGILAFTGAGLAWAPLPFLAHYAASKAALDIFVEGLAQEVGPFGIQSVIFEPGGFASRLGQPRAGSDLGFGTFQPAVKDYEKGFGEVMNLFATDLGVNIQSQTDKLAQRIVDVVAGQGLAKGKKLPLRVVLGRDALAIVKQKCEQQLSLAKEWEEVSVSTGKDGENLPVSEACLKLMSITK